MIENIDNNVKSPLISIIVCAFSLDRFDKTVDCIYSIFNGTYKNYEIILVIDGNGELKRKVDNKFKGIENITIIENIKNEGPSISRNRGIERAHGNIVVFIDDDAFVSPGWLENIVKNFLEYPEIFVVGGKLLPVYENGAKKLPEELLWIVGGTYKGHPENRQHVRNVFTGNMAVKKDILKDVNFETICDKKKIGVLSHQIEDTLFCVRVNNIKSNTVLYDPDIIAYHHVPNNRLKLSYILKRAIDEGMLKAKLKLTMNGNNTDDTLSSEHNYLNVVLKSIIQDFYTFKIRDGMLISLTVLCVSIGYTSCILKERLAIGRS